MDEKEAERKAKKFTELTKSTTENAAKSFEKWLIEHKDSTKEEAHEQLVETITKAVMINTMMLGIAML